MYVCSLCMYIYVYVWSVWIMYVYYVFYMYIQYMIICIDTDTLHISISGKTDTQQSEIIYP